MVELVTMEKFPFDTVTLIFSSMHMLTYTLFSPNSQLLGYGAGE